MIKLTDILNEIANSLNVSWDDFINSDKVDVKELRSELGLSIDDFKNLYLKTIAKLSKLKFPLKIYRAVSLKDGDTVDTINLGHHWTFEKASAEPYEGDPKGRIVILEGYVSLQDIDVLATIAYNMLIPHENEIYVINPSNIELTSK